MKKLMAVLTLSLTTFGSSAASAEPSSVKDILAELSKLAAEKQELERGFQIALSIKQDLDAQREALLKKRQQLDARKAELQDYCKGEYPEPEYSWRVAKCDANGQALNSDIDEHNQEVSSFAAEYRDLANAVEKMSQRDDEIIARVRYLTARLKALQLFANSDCGKSEDLETVVDCFQHQWDGGDQHAIRIPDPSD